MQLQPQSAAGPASGAGNAPSKAFAQPQATCGTGMSSPSDDTSGAPTASMPSATAAGTPMAEAPLSGAPAEPRASIEAKAQSTVPGSAATFEKLSQDALAAAVAAARSMSVGANTGPGSAEAADAAARAAMEAMKQQLRQHGLAAPREAGTGGTTATAQSGQRRPREASQQGSPDVPPTGNASINAAPDAADLWSIACPLPTSARAAAGPTQCSYSYDLSPGDDTELCFRNLRRRIEVELGDGCAVQMCLHLVR